VCEILVYIDTYRLSFRNLARMRVALTVLTIWICSSIKESKESILGNVLSLNFA